MSMIEDDARRSDPFLDSSDQDSENVEEERESDFGSTIGLGKRTSPPELRRLLGLAWPQVSEHVPFTSLPWRLTTSPLTPFLIHVYSPRP